MERIRHIARTVVGPGGSQICPYGKVKSSHTPQQCAQRCPHGNFKQHCGGGCKASLQCYHVHWQSKKQFFNCGLASGYCQATSFHPPVFFCKVKHSRPIDTKTHLKTETEQNILVISSTVLSSMLSCSLAVKETVFQLWVGKWLLSGHFFPPACFFLQSQTQQAN